MAIRRSAAASVSTTLGIAAATLMIAGAIVAWPTVSRCSAEPGGFGACLRDALADRGLATPEDGLPAPVAPAGWLDARANEIVPPVLPSIELNDRGSIVTVDEVELKPAAPQVALLPAEAIDPLGTTPSPVPGPTATLQPARAIDVTGSIAETAPQAKVALVGPVGAITATAPSPVAIDGGAAALTPGPAGTIAAEGSIALAPDTPALPVSPLPVPLGRALAPVPPAPIPVELTAEIAPPPSPEPPAPAPKPPAPEPQPPAPEPELPTPAPEPLISFDPAYPNVLVLPPPATGEDSSIRTWTFD